MELRVLRYFLTVANEENISRAAQTLQITQPTLSRQLHDLEEEVGMQLFERGARKITLTPQGILLKRRAKEILDLVDKTEHELIVADEATTGTICLQASGTAADSRLASWIKGFGQRCPKVEFVLQQQPRQEILDSINQGYTDFGILLGHPDEERYDSIKLLEEEEMVLLTRSNSALARKLYITPADLKNTAVIKPDDPWLRTRLEMWSQPDKLPSTAYTDDIAYAASFVHAGIGPAFVLDPGKEISLAKGLEIRPLRPGIHVSCSIFWKKDEPMSRAASLFLQYIQENS